MLEAAGSWWWASNDWLVSDCLAGVFSAPGASPMQTAHLHMLFSSHAAVTHTTAHRSLAQSQPEHLLHFPGPTAACPLLLLCVCVCATHTILNRAAHLCQVGQLLALLIVCGGI